MMGLTAKSLLFVFVVMLTMPTYAVDKSCERVDEIEHVNPTVALCSVHAYNINRADGTMSNPKSEEREMMKEVIALKSTVITQQMKKQYDYMDAMLKRFRIQLEKAILTTKLQAAGATDGTGGSGSGSFVSTDKTIRLAGAQNCMTTTYANSYTCLTQNLQLVMNAVNGGNNIADAKKQLKSDLSVANAWEIIKCTDADNFVCGLNQCNKLKTSSKREDVVACAQELNVNISRKQYEWQQEQTKNNQQR